MYGYVYIRTRTDRARNGPEGPIRPLESRGLGRGHYNMGYKSPPPICFSGQTRKATAPEKKKTNILAAVGKPSEFALQKEPI